MYNAAIREIGFIICIPVSVQGMLRVRRKLNFIGNIKMQPALFSKAKLLQPAERIPEVKGRENYHDAFEVLKNETDQK